MYSIETFQDTYTFYRIKKDNETCFEVIPEYGAFITRYQHQGKEILYMDKESLLNGNPSTRGGNPVLFPVCGWLKDGKWNWKGKVYDLPGHGFARTSSWKVVSTCCTEEKADIILELTSDKETRKGFPFDFRVQYRYQLTESSLTIFQTYINDSDEEIPFFAGFHPYFQFEDKASVQVTTGATRFWLAHRDEYKDLEEPVDFTAPDINHVLLDAPIIPITIKDTKNDQTIILERDKAFPIVVLWTVENEPFICVEPWMDTPDGLNRLESVPKIKPFSELHARFCIKIEK